MTRIAILHDERHPLLRQVGLALRSRQAEVTMIPWSDLTFDFTGRGARCATLTRYDAVFLDRLGESVRSYHTQLDLLAASDAASRTVNSPRAYRVARDKALAQGAMVDAGLPVPAGRVVMSAVAPREGFGSQVAVKSTLGVCAEEVWLGLNANASAPVGEILAHDGMALVQEYVDNPSRSIWRVDVVDGSAISINRRFAASDDGLPLANAGQGGEVEFADPRGTAVASHIALALEATAAMGLSIAGVDMIEREDGSLVILETNPEPDATDDPELSDLLPRAIADLLLETAGRGA